MHLYIVTGASRGLGWALVEEIAKDADASMLAVSRSGLPRPTARTEDLHCDLSSAEGQREAADCLRTMLRKQHWGKAVLINNAGMVEPVGSLERCDPDELVRSLEVNLVAPVMLMQAFLDASADVPERTVINISSGAARRPYFGWTAYCAGKAGLDMASQVVALESKRTGNAVRVVSLAPGVIDTAMQADVRSKNPKDFPDVVRFQALKAHGELKSPQETAARIIAMERDGTLPQGVADLRDI